MLTYQSCEICKNFGTCEDDEIRERQYLRREGKDCFEPENKITSYVDYNNSVCIRVPKPIARVKLCGGALTFTFDDTMHFEMPTKEQCENLKKTFGIEVELVDED